MTLRLTESETDALRAHADTEGRSMQEVARAAVREYVERHTLRSSVQHALDELTPRYAALLERLGQ